jgi:uncharacterized protein with PIN domain
MANIEFRINKIVEGAVSRRITAAKAVEKLLQEIGRGGRILAVDENLYDLARELWELGYTTHLVLSSNSDEDTKVTLPGKVLITINGKDFVDDTEKYRYGLIWVRKSTDAKILAKKVETVLMSANFRRNVTQSVMV